MKNRRQLRFDNWESVFDDIRLLQDQCYENSKRSNLSLGQICDHLAAIMETAVDGPAKMMPWPMRAMARAMMLKKMMRHEPTWMRVPAPLAVAPKARVDDEQGIARLKAAVEKFENHTGEYKIHMAFGKLTRDQWKHQQLWHCEHHLSFLLPLEAVA